MSGEEKEVHGLTPEEHEILSAESIAFSERLEARLGRPVDVIVVSHFPDKFGGGCVTHASSHLGVADEDTLVLHMLEEGIQILCPEEIMSALKAAKTH